MVHIYTVSFNYTTSHVSSNDTCQVMTRDTYLMSRDRSYCSRKPRSWSLLITWGRSTATLTALKRSVTLSNSSNWVVIRCRASSVLSRLESVYYQTILEILNCNIKLCFGTELFNILSRARFEKCKSFYNFKIYSLISLKYLLLLNVQTNWTVVKW